MCDADLQLRDDLGARVVNLLRQVFPLAAALDPQRERELDRRCGDLVELARAVADEPPLLLDELPAVLLVAGVLDGPAAHRLADPILVRRPTRSSTVQSSSRTAAS